MLGKDTVVELREPCFEGRPMAGAALLDRIYKHGPEYDAGLRAGDIVTHVNGQEVHSWPQLAGHYLRSADITLVARRGTTEIKRAFRGISLDELDRRLLAEIGLAVQPVEQTLEPAIEVAHAAGPSAASFSTAGRSRDAAQRHRSRR